MIWGCSWFACPSRQQQQNESCSRQGFPVTKPLVPPAERASNCSLEHINLSMNNCNQPEEQEERYKLLPHSNAHRAQWRTTISVHSQFLIECLCVSSCDDIDLMIGQMLPAHLIIPCQRSGESQSNASSALMGKIGVIEFCLRQFRLPSIASAAKVSNYDYVAQYAADCHHR